MLFDEEIYDQLLVVLGYTCLIVNLGTSCLIYFVPPKSGSWITKATFVMRIFYGFHGFMQATLMKTKLVFPLLCSVSGGLVHKIGGKNLTNILTIYAFLSAYIELLLILLTVQMRYSVFVLKKESTYIPRYEKIGIFVFAIIVPVISMGAAPFYALTPDEIAYYYPNDLKVLAPFNNSNYSVVVYDKTFPSPFIIMELINIGIMNCLGSYAIFFKYNYLVIELQKSIKECRTETSNQLKDAIFKIKVAVFVPFIFGMAPLFIPLVFVITTNIHDANEFFRFLGAQVIISVISYFILGAFISIYQLYGLDYRRLFRRNKVKATIIFIRSQNNYL